MTLLATKAGSISYQVVGSGPPVVLLRGLGRTVRHWLGYDKALARQAKVQVITIDLRGMGASTVRAGWGTSIFANGDDIVAVLDHLGIDQAHMMGVSLGGMVVLGLGLRRPERCLSLLVMNTSIAGQRTLRLAPRAILALTQAARYHDERFHAGLVSVLVSRGCPQPTQAKIARRYAAIAKDEGLFVWTVVKQLVAAARFLVKKDLEKMPVPTLVLYGTDDQFVPNANSQKLAALLPHCRLVALPGAGHEISLDRPDELSEVVASWVGGGYLDVDTSQVDAV